MYLRHSYLLFGTSDMFPNFEEIKTIDSAARFIKGFNGKIFKLISRLLEQIQNEDFKNEIFLLLFEELKEHTKRIINDLKEQIRS